MTTITINAAEGLTLQLPDDFQPQAITGYHAWLELLAVSKRGRGNLRCAGNRFCCLGVKLQQEGMRWARYNRDKDLPEDLVSGWMTDPSGSIASYSGKSGLGSWGQLNEAKVVVTSIHGARQEWSTLADFNDAWPGDDFTDIITVIRHCFCERVLDL